MIFFTKKAVGEDKKKPTKESSYLPLSQAGIVTPFHQNFSGTSVMYILVKD